MYDSKVTKKSTLKTTITIENQQSSTPTTISFPSSSQSSQSIITMNPSNELQILSKIDTQVSGELSWMLDGKTLSRSSSSSILSPTQSFLDMSSQSSQSTSTSSHLISSLNLVISPNTLSGNSFYTFTLLFTPSNSSLSPRSSSITVYVNNPPMRGSFKVTPSSGAEISTLFEFSSLYWSDSDQPLTYQFGYTSMSGEFLSLGSRSGMRSSESILPRGKDSKNFGLECMVKVFDS